MNTVSLNKIDAYQLARICRGRMNIVTIERKGDDIYDICIGHESGDDFDVLIGWTVNFLEGNIKPSYCSVMHKEVKSLVSNAELSGGLLEFSNIQALRLLYRVKSYLKGMQAQGADQVDEDAMSFMDRV